jgi:trans-aconitate methyltransferase
MKNSVTPDLQPIVRFYEDLIERYGPCFRACDYGSARSQAAKFRVLADVCSLADMRVLDVGCGFADYAEYLAGRYDRVEYQGIDITPRMIQEARRQRPQLSLRVGNILEEDPGRFDVVTANGIFYLFGPGSQSKDRMETLIARLYELADRAVAFNSLSTWASNMEPNEYYADPLETVLFCRTLTPWLTLRHDYLPHDFTVYMYKEKPGI